jgi:hypothetical protein
VAVLRPPVLLIGFIARPLYRLLFSRSDKKMAKEQEERLANDIQSYLPFLFSEMEGRIVPNEGVEFPLPFDYAIVTMDLPYVLLRFTRGRDHLAVQVAPKFSPNGWHELTTILSVLDVPGVKRGSISNLSQAGSLLRSNMKEIVRVFADDQYPLLKTQLREIYARDRVATKQLETELNRRLYD